jgi:hypothetical protein
VTPKRIFVVTPELQRLLDAVPGKELRSKLDPFAAYILRWRRQGKSYRRIQQILADKCGVKVSYDALRGFVLRRSRSACNKELDLAPASKVTAPEQVLPSSAPVDATTDPWAEARARMRQFKAAPPAAKREKLFEFTEEDAIRPHIFTKEENN